ncbi:MAG: hypothetical protein IJB88_06700 [Clostridia bacterium]|nr:hypothetical protein [Clostridia bacterium]
MSFFALFRKKQRKNSSHDFNDEKQSTFVRENNVQASTETSAEPAVKEEVALEYTLEQLMEIVEQENLSMLISGWESNGQGIIFDHRHFHGDTVLRAFDFGFWYVHYETGSKAREEDVHFFNNRQEACRKALEYAREEKLKRMNSYSNTNPRILRWSLDDEGTLTLSGKGPMLSPFLPQYRVIDKDQMAFELEFGDWMLNEGDVKLEFTLPWDGQKVRKVIIEPGLTTVATNAFNIFSHIVNNCCFNETYQLLEEIILPDKMESLERISIQNCPVLQKVVIPASVRDICESEYGAVFRNCPCVRIHTPVGSYAEAFAQRNNILTVSPSSVGEATAPADSLPSK